MRELLIAGSRGLCASIWWRLTAAATLSVTFLERMMVSFELVETEKQKLRLGMSSEYLTERNFREF